MSVYSFFMVHWARSRVCKRLDILFLERALSIPGDMSYRGMRNTLDPLSMGAMHTQPTTMQFMSVQILSSGCPAATHPKASPERFSTSRVLKRNKHFILSKNLHVIQHPINVFIWVQHMAVSALYGVVVGVNKFVFHFVKLQNFQCISRTYYRVYMYKVLK